MRKLHLLLLGALALTACSHQPDLIVYGGSAAGVMAAYSAAQEGLDVVLIEPTCRFGALTAGGIGQTDIGNKQVVKGLALQFYRRLGAHYGNLENWIFEPSAALEVFEGYLDHPRIKAIKNYHLVDAAMDGTRISGIRVANGADTLSFVAPWFIDCSYEGDLMAAAGVEYRVGRESNEEYGETWNGVQMLQGHQFPDGVDPFVQPGRPESGLLWGVSDASLRATGSGDGLVQAYNFRPCLTDSLENRIPIEKPAGYDPARYELLARLIAAQPEKTRLKDYFIWSIMPGRKTDVNNRGGFSTDMIGMNHSYPEASWEERQAIVQAHKDYTLGLLWFMGNDPRVPESIRSEISRWGLPKDEYTDTDHWSPHLYIRECRRLVGEYVATQDDCENRRVAPDGIAMAAYTMDSHNCQRIAVKKNGRWMVKNEGNVEIGGGLPYPISYRSLTPKRAQCSNLLVPVCCSASHIAYGSIRMEPVYMCLGQAAGLAVSLAHHQGLACVQDVDYRDIVRILQTDPFQDGTAPDIVLDDPQLGEIPGWHRWGLYNSYGRSCLFGEHGAAPAVFSAEIPATGTYTVYSYQHQPQPNVNPRTEITLSTGQTFAFDASEVRIAGQTTSAWHPLCSVRLRKGELFTATFSIPETITSGPDTEIPLSDAVRETINPKEHESSAGWTLADAVLLVKQ
ncbi:MAG: FAD-dependent oxidoreductase [Bacteroidales bacterium]|nr:FAD-dependent oxidoreductase [Bacteroidales bacterium]